MRLRPLIYVSDLEAALTFWGRLGFAPTPLRRRNMVEIEHEGQRLALHRADPPPPTSHPRPRVLITLEVGEDLEPLRDRLRAEGALFERDLTDEAWGWSLALRDPDGLIVQLNRHDPELTR